MANILYPPNLPSSIPAAYKKGNTIYFTVPFSFNMATNYNEIKSSYVRISTLSGDKKITSSVGVPEQNSLIFSITNSKELNIGQYYKIQVAWASSWSQDETELIWSAPATFKYIGAASVQINSLNLNCITTNNSQFVGQFNCDDKQEKIYSYRFIVRDDKNNIIKDSGTLIHNNLDISNNTDKFELLETFEDEEIKYYTIQYIITTINGLTLMTPEYKFQTKFLLSSTYENGYFDILLNTNNENGYVDIIIKTLDKDKLQTIDGTFKVVRSADSGKTWREIGRLKISQLGFKQALFRDRTVEHGQKYVYALQEYYQNLVSRRFPLGGLETDIIDLEHCFISDGQRQLKIKYNPKISSFKTTLLESKTNTLGGKYPFFFKNGNVAYKEFPISGLISQLMDEEGLFAAASSVENKTRQSTKSLDIVYLEPATATNLTGNNIYNENQFKQEVLDWLNNGELKYFRSASEGNYIVRLMNTSLSPNDTLGRMLHTFNTTAIEAQENNYANLLSMGLYDLKLKNYVDSSLAYFGSIQLIDLKPGDNILNKNNIRQDQIQNMFLEDCADGDIFELNGIQIRIGKTGSYYYNDLVHSLKYIGYEGIYGSRPTDLMGSKLVYKMQGQITTIFKMITDYTTTIYPIKQFIGSEYKGLENYNILSDFINIKNSIKINYLRCYIDSYLNPYGTDTKIKINDQVIQLQPEGNNPDKRHYYELIVPEDMEINSIILGDKTVCEMYCEITEKTYGYIESLTEFEDLIFKLARTQEAENFANIYDFEKAYNTIISNDMLAWDNKPIAWICQTLSQVTNSKIDYEKQFKILTDELRNLKYNDVYKPWTYWNTALNNYKVFIQSLYNDYLILEIKGEEGLKPNDNTTITA